MHCSLHLHTNVSTSANCNTARAYTCFIVALIFLCTTLSLSPFSCLERFNLKKIIYIVLLNSSWFEMFILKQMTLRVGTRYLRHRQVYYKN